MIYVAGKHGRERHEAFEPGRQSHRDRHRRPGRPAGDRQRRLHPGQVSCTRSRTRFRSGLGLAAAPRSANSIPEATSRSSFRPASSAVRHPSRPVPRIYGWPVRVPDNTQLGHAIADTVRGAPVSGQHEVSSTFRPWAGSRLAWARRSCRAFRRAVAEHRHLRTAPIQVSWTNRTNRAPIATKATRAITGSTAIRSTSRRSSEGTSARCARSTSCCVRTRRVVSAGTSRNPWCAAGRPGDSRVEPQPFFVNPTSCETDKVRLEARRTRPG